MLKKLTSELQKSDMDFWVDWEGIPPTVDWWREIEKGIEEADAFIFLISPDSSASKVCAQEIDCAVKNSKRIIPIVVRDVRGDEAPKQLSHLNWIFFREQDDFDAAIQKLLTAIHTDYEWVQNHRRLQVKALEWERNHKESGFLLRGKDLLDAETNLAVNTSKEPHPTDLQREYVFQSRKSTDRQRRLLTSISIVGVIALALLAVFGFVQARNATQAQNKAEQETRRATAGKLALESKSALEEYPQRALLLALEAARVNQAAGEPASPEAEEALRSAVERVPGIRLDDFEKSVYVTRFTEENGIWLTAVGGELHAPTLRIWNVKKAANDPAYQPTTIVLGGFSKKGSELWGG
ncbi:MAG TPA: toll/interleukin-1 receptor domain-containing protein [Anaerolineales bacterium]|nr:toll/interleukin-1 receptor domain-containing protein [Anaerolineales bacterium]